MGTKPIRTLRSILGHIEIAISMDQLNASLSLFPSKSPDREFTAQEIESMLADEGIVHGIDQKLILSTINEINESKASVQDILIARGTPMLPQQDASIIYHFCTDTNIHLREDDKGRVNYHELGQIHTVEKGTLVAEKVPCKEGIAGLSLYGETINPGVPRDNHIVAGKNVEVSANGLECIALCAGQVFLKNRILHVSPVFKVDHDVDLNVGNIRFNGAVLIHGNVLAGFSVQATGDITILGVVEGAKINCGGNLIAKGGIKGSEKCKIHCRQDFITSFIEGAAVECQGNLFVDSVILNSSIRCYSKIRMGSTKGHIVGGSILGVQGIQCQEVGSKLGVFTRVIIGDKLIVKERMKSVAEELRDKNEALKKINQGMLKHKRLFDELSLLPSEKQDPLLQILESLEMVKKRIEELQITLDKLQKLFQFRCLATFKVFRRIYPNTAIQIGHSHIKIKEKMSACIFRENEAQGVVDITGF